jgi:hypothetical protein
MTPRGGPSPDDESDLDAQWHDIVARLGDLKDADDLDDDADLDDAGPDADLDRFGDDPARSDDARDAAGRDARSHTVRPAGAGAEPTSDPRSWVPDPAVEEAEDHFVPPDPGPVLGGDPVLTMAWVVVVAAPLLVVASMIAWQDAPSWMIQVAGAAFLAAVGVLLWRLPHRRDEDDDDPGAVV